MNKSVRITSVLLIVISILSDGCGLFKPRSTDENGNTINKNSKFDNKTVRDIISTARDYKGTPYKYGGTTRSGMDCSGLVTVAFNSANLKLPRVSSDMAKVGREVSVRDLRQGDLLFFITGKEDKISHVGIVTDVKSKNEIYFIHAADSGVKEDNLFTKYYQKAFTKAMRPF
jgi:probable lipoprotein NlpC